MESIQERTGPADGCKYGSVAHQIILIAGDQVEEAGRDLQTTEGGREVGEVLTDRFVVVLTVAPDESLLTLQTNLEQSELIVPLLLQPLQPRQVLAGPDGHRGVAALAGRGCLPSRDETPPVPGRAVHHLPLVGPQDGPVPLQLEDGPRLVHSQQGPGRDNPSVEVKLLPGHNIISGRGIDLFLPGLLASGWI